MKKIILILILAISLAFSLITINIFKELSFFNTIIKDHDKINFSYSSEHKKHTDDASKYFRKIANNHHVGLTKVTYTGENDVLFNTNEKKLLNKRDNKHQLNLFDSKINITVENLANTHHLTEEGTYYLTGSSTDKEKVIALINKNVGETVSIETEDFLSYLTIDTYSFSFLMLLGILVIIAYCHYLQRNKYNYKTLADFGYSVREIVNFIFRDLKQTLISYAIIFVMVGIGIYIIIYNDVNLFKPVIIFIFTIIAGLILLSLITFINISIFMKGFYKNQTQPNITLFIYTYILLAIVMTVFFTTSVNQLLSNSKEYRSIASSMKNWDYTKNVYKIVKAENGAHHKKSIELTQDKKFEKLFKSKNNFGFLIDTENFMGEDEGDPLYLVNEEEDSNIEADGKTITIDENYLKLHKRENINGKDVLNQIVHKKYTRNILVPIKFKSDEKKIVKNFKEDFNFKRTLSDNSEKIKTPVDINIIYVRNNIKYPTYEQTIGGKDNKIKAPIAIVETGNVSKRNFQHYMAMCYFFESKSKQPYNDIEPILKKYHLTSDLPAIESVYNTKIDEMKEIKGEIVKYVVLALLTLISFIIALITAIYLYFVNWKYTIFIKYNLGYSTLSTHKYPLLLLILMNFILLMLLVNHHLVEGLVIFGSILVLEIIIVAFEFLILNQKNKNDILKGKE